MENIVGALTKVHPALPFGILTILIWLAQYALRKFVPNFWESCANYGKFGDVDLSTFWTLLRKGWQGAPSVLAGALIGQIAMSQQDPSSVDYRGAWMGALAGLAAPVWHEILKAVPWIPYRGETKTNKLPISALIVLLALPLAGCGAGALARLAPVLADVAIAVSDAANALDSIESVSDAYFAVKPDPAEQGKIRRMIGLTRLALSTATHATKGAQSLEQKDVDGAFAEFRSAYSDLTKELETAGVTHRGADGRVSAVGGFGAIPEPMALDLKVRQ